MFFNFLFEKLCVDLWRQGEEGLAEARTERSLGFGDSGFRTGDLGGVAVEEVLHGLLRGELGDGGEDAECIGGQEDDVLGVSADAWDDGAFDMVDGVGAAGVFGE